jgi:hypothetical protein
MLILREQGIQDVMAMEIWPAGTRYRRFVGVGTTNKAQEMLLLWEQVTVAVVAVRARHMRCYCGLWEPGTKIFRCGSMAKKILLLLEQGTGNAVAVGAS